MMRLDNRWAVALLAILLLTSTGQAWSASEPVMLADMVRLSDRIVEGRVTSFEFAKETHAMNDRGGTATFVVTHVIIAATDHLRGKPTASVQVRLLGGFWEDYAVIDSEGPDIKLGEDVILFLRESPSPRQSDNTTTHYLAAGRYGKFRVSTVDGNRVVERQAIPEYKNDRLGVTASAARGDHAVDYDAFKTLVASETRRQIGKGESR